MDTTNVIVINQYAVRDMGTGNKRLREFLLQRYSGYENKYRDQSAYWRGYAHWGENKTEQML